VTAANAAAAAVVGWRVAAVTAAAAVASCGALGRRSVWGPLSARARCKQQRCRDPPPVTAAAGGPQLSKPRDLCGE